MPVLVELIDTLSEDVECKKCGAVLTKGMPAKACWINGTRECYCLGHYEEAEIIEECSLYVVDVDRIVGLIIELIAASGNIKPSEVIKGLFLLALKQVGKDLRWESLQELLNVKRRNK